MSSRRELLNLLGLPTKYLSHTLVNIENLQHFLLQQKGDGLYHYFFLYCSGDSSLFSKTSKIYYNCM